MADRKISDLTALTTPASGDYLPIVDISEAAAVSKNKRITIEELFRGVPSGTAAAPSIAIEGDEDTGVYSPGANQLAISTGGTGRLFVDASGNVGISAAPDVRFAFGDFTSNEAIRFRQAVNGYGTIYFANGSSGANLYQGFIEYGAGTAGDFMRFGTAQNERLRITSTGALNFVGAGTAGSTQAVSFNGSAPVNSLVIDSSGRLGVGTSSPSQTLQINGTVGHGVSGTAGTYDQFFYPNSGTDTIYWLRNTANAFSIGTGATAGTNARFTIAAGGNVGIGTSSPGQALQVVGSIGVNTGTAASVNGSGISIYDASFPRLTFRNSTTGDTTGDGTQLVQDGLNFNIGNTEAGEIKLFTSNTQRATIDSSGRVGIGTTSPSDNLQINQSASNSTTGITLSNTTESEGGGSAITFRGAYGAPGSANNLIARISGFVTSVTGAKQGNIAFETGTNNSISERARIDSSGRLLVGTSSTSANTRMVLLGNSGGAGGAANLHFSYDGATPVDGQGLGYLIFGDNTQSNGAWINAARDGGTWSGSSKPSRLVFSTTADGASSPTERMRITQAGFFKATNTAGYISATGSYHELRSSTDNSEAVIVSHSGTSGTQYGLTVLTASDQNDATRWFFKGQGATTERFTARSNGGLANYQANNVNLSDRNAKKDISPAAGTWDCIKEWEIVNYRYKDQPDDVNLNLGVIAQQVAESCPEVITVFQEAKEAKPAVLDEEGNEVEPAQEAQPERLGVKEQQMYWMAIKALQEAQVRIEALEAEVAALKAS